MWITINGINSTEIDTSVFKRVLSLYPEEKLEDRKIFQQSLAKDAISLKELKSESDIILIPWQMFLLTEDNLNIQLSHIDAQRLHKVSPKLLTKRKGVGDVTSKRILDRLIRQQNFLSSQNVLPQNTFCGSIKGLSILKAVDYMLTHFNIDRGTFWSYTGKGSALEYLIRQIELKNINISRGVLTNKILPTSTVVPSNVYRNTSGFVIKDDFVPFIFLPSEINPDEVESRQIYTLVYLLTAIGLEQYDYFLEKDFTGKMFSATGIDQRLHIITTEILMPSKEFEKFRGQTITLQKRDDIAAIFKVSPSALVTTLRMRSIITKQEYDLLKPGPYVPNGQKRPVRSAKVSTSARKFCGKISFQVINSAIQSGALTSIQAQYLIFGAVNKKGFTKYRNELNI